MVLVIYKEYFQTKLPTPLLTMIEHDNGYLYQSNTKIEENTIAAKSRWGNMYSGNVRLISASLVPHTNKGRQRRKAFKGQKRNCYNPDYKNRRLSLLRE